MSGGRYRDRVVGEDGVRNPDLIREMEARGSVNKKTPERVLHRLRD